MTTRISEALRAVADATAAPDQDRLEFQRLVRAERRRRLAGRAGIAVAAAAVVAAVVASVLPFVHHGEDDAVPAGTPGRIHLQRPVFVVVDGYLNVVDPNGDVHDVGEPAEDVLGSTASGAYVVGGDSQVLHYEARPGGSWRFGRAPGSTVDVVQSAQLSADGRYLGWVDLRDRVHVRDLATGTNADPVRARGSGYLADLASRTGTALVVDDRGLVLHRLSGAQVVLTGDSWDATVAGDRVAVPAPSRTNSTIYRVLPDNDVTPLFDVPGSGRLSPLGDLVASRGDDRRVRERQPEGMAEEGGDGEPVGEAAHDRRLEAGRHELQPGRSGERSAREDAAGSARRARANRSGTPRRGRVHAPRRCARWSCRPTTRAWPASP